MSTVADLQSDLIIGTNKPAMTPLDEQQDFSVSMKSTPQGKVLHGKVQTEEGRSPDQGEENKGQEQVAMLPAEVLNIILSYTGTRAAVLAAGPAGMRTWSSLNIAEWLHHCTVIRSHGSDEQQSAVYALLQAVRHGLDEPAKLLFVRSGGPDSSEVWNAVTYTAAVHGCVTLVSTVMDWLWDRSEDKGLARQACRRMMTAACQAGQLRVVKELLDEAQPYACRANEPDNAYLMTAAEYGHVDIVKELLDPAREHCAAANARNSEALRTAAIYGRVDVLLELLDTSREHHCNANDDRCFALSDAAAMGHLNCVRVLLDTSRPSYASANAMNNMALLFAAMNGYAHIIQELLDSSRPNHATADASENAAVHFAAKKGHMNALRALLWQEHHPADPQSPEGVKALEEAVSQGNLECCRLLLGYPGLPPRRIDTSLLKKAAESRNPAVLALLKQVNKRYSYVTGPPAIRAYLFRYLPWYTLCLTQLMDVIISWKIPSLSRTYKTLLYTVYAIIAVDFLVSIFFWVYGPARRKTLERQAAIQNAEYRAAWHKSQEK